MAEDHACVPLTEDLVPIFLAPQNGLDEPAARALYEIAVIGYGHSESNTALTAAAAIQLQQQGLVQRQHASESLDPSDDVRYSLLLDDPR